MTESDTKPLSNMARNFDGRPPTYRHEGVMKVITGRMTPDQIVAFREIGGWKWLRAFLDVYRGVRTPEECHRTRKRAAAKAYLKATLVEKGNIDESALND